MLEITLTPTMITIQPPQDEIFKQLTETYEMEYNEKGYYFIKDKPGNLYKILLKLSYTYDIEIS